MRLTPSFENFETNDNQSLEYAKKSLEGFSKLLIEKKGIIGMPVIVGIQGRPGVGKTHLISALRSELENAEISFLDTNENEFLLSVNKNYKNKNNFLLLADDLYQEAASLDDISDLELGRLGELIFELYERNGILVVSSNFAIKDIFERVSRKDPIGRLKSRCNQLLLSIKPLNIDAPDYREKLAKISGQTSDLFNQSMGAGNKLDQIFKNVGIEDVNFAHMNPDCEKEIQEGKENIEGVLTSKSNSTKVKEEISISQENKDSDLEIFDILNDLENIVNNNALQLKKALFGSKEWFVPKDVLKKATGELMSKYFSKNEKIVDILIKLENIINNNALELKKSFFSEKGELFVPKDVLIEKFEECKKK